MAIKASITADELEGLDDGIKGQYTEQGDGTFVLNLEGTPSGFVDSDTHKRVKASRDTFRDRNDALLGEAAKIVGQDRVEDLSAVRSTLEAYKGIDLEEYKKLKAELKEKGADPKTEGIKGIIDAALEPLQTRVSELTTKLEQADVDRAKSQEKLGRVELERFMLPIINKASPVEGAAPKVVREAHSAFEWDPVARKPKAKEGRENENGAPISPEEWVLGMRKGEYSFAFQQSTGGGSQSGADLLGGPSAGGKKQLVDPTPKQLGEYSRLPKEKRADIEIVYSGDQQ